MTKDEALKLALEALKQIDEAMPFPVAKLAQAAIKEALAQPEQEPVGKFAKFTDGIWREVTDGSAGVSLYIAPQRKPLTDEEIMNIAKVSCIGISPQEDTLNFAKVIEAVHGIKGEA